MRVLHVLPLAACAALLSACGDESSGPSNVGPIAAFTVQCDELDCTLINGSRDPDGTIEAYEWSFGDDEGATTRDAVHTYLEPGRFTVRLLVIDDDGWIARAAQQVDVSDTNIAPTADFTVSCTDLTCVFSDRSFDADAGGSVASYAWDFGDGETSTEANPVHSYLVAGDYTVTLIVTDDLGKTGAVSRVVTITAPSDAPPDFPPVPPDALTYNRVSAETSGTFSRYLLYEDGTFALQYVTARWDFFEYTGRYSRVDASLGFKFDANRGEWQATGTLQGDSLVVTYNLDMALNDFENGVYRRIAK